MDYKNECRELHIKIGDYVLTNDFELLAVVKILTDGVIVAGGRQVNCDEILDVKGWEKINAKQR